MLQTRKITSSRKGMTKLPEQGGDPLFCVRYRHNEVQGERFKTTKLIIEEASWQPLARPFEHDEIVAISLNPGNSLAQSAKNRRR